MKVGYFAVCTIFTNHDSSPDEKEHVTLPAGFEICQDVVVETHQGQNIEGATDADPHKYPGLLELSFITMALCLSVFLVAL